MPVSSGNVSTPVDRGLAGAADTEAVVVPFESPGGEKWGVYAAAILAEELGKTRAFRAVSASRDCAGACRYIVKGSIDHLYYGGTEDPSAVFLKVSVSRREEPEPRFVRIARLKAGEAAFDLSQLRMTDPASPPVEDMIGRLLRDTAVDIASRTRLPAVEDP